MNEKTWSKEEVLLLIGHWKKHPELWNVKHQEYRNKGKKRITLQEIAEKLETTEQEIDRKFHNLRTQFHQELRRTKKNEEVGNTYKSSWKYFDAMSFIVSDSSNSNVFKKMKREKEYENNVSNEETKQSYIRHETLEEKKKQPTETQETNTIFNETVRVVDKPVDDFQIFGDFVASELRSLQSRDNQIRLKRMIQRAILEVSELDDIHDENDSVSAIFLGL